MSQPYLIVDIANLCEGEIIQEGNAETEIKSILIDSRRISNPYNSVFIAVKGDRHNGHKFL
jgi:UDP-N-acetylmuramyl pentapeptide synthase